VQSPVLADISKETRRTVVTLDGLIFMLVGVGAGYWGYNKYNEVPETKYTLKTRYSWDSPLFDFSTFGSATLEKLRYKLR